MASDTEFPLIVENKFPFKIKACNLFKNGSLSEKTLLSKSLGGSSSCGKITDVGTWCCVRVV